MNAPIRPDITSYWNQIYHHLRHRCGCSHHEAEDFTQDLFVRLLEKGSLEKLSARFGSEDEQRNYLFAAACNLFNSAKRRDSAAKRGGGAIHLSVGTEDEQVEPTSNTNTPSEDAEHGELRAHWQCELSTLENDATRQGKLAIFSRVCGELAPGGCPVDSRAAATELGVTPRAIRVQIHRWRERLFENMRAGFQDAIAA